jgi:hypothetical protein
MPKRNFSGALAIPAGTTGAITGPDLVNTEGAAGVVVVVNVTVNAGGLGALTCVIEGKDYLSRTYYTLLASARCPRWR